MLVLKTGIELVRFLTIYGICGMTVCGRRHFYSKWSISLKVFLRNETVLNCDKCINLRAQKNSEARTPRLRSYDQEYE